MVKKLLFKKGNLPPAARAAVAVGGATAAEGVRVASKYA